jgi:hypothetical protein
MTSESMMDDTMTDESMTSESMMDDTMTDDSMSGG